MTYAQAKLVAATVARSKNWRTMRTAAEVLHDMAHPSVSDVRDAFKLARMAATLQCRELSHKRNAANV